MSYDNQAIDPDVAEALNFLKEKFVEIGYLRHQDITKYGAQYRAQRHATYKKGSEVRFRTRNEEELQAIRKAIATLGLTVSNTYLHNGKIMQPLYGLEITREFYNLNVAKKKAREEKRIARAAEREKKAAIRAKKRAEREALKKERDAQRAARKAQKAKSKKKPAKKKRRSTAEDKKTVRKQKNTKRE